MSVLTTKQILEIIPHRQPFLLIDTVEELELSLIHIWTYTSLRNQLKQAYLAFLIFAQRNQTCQRHPEHCALHCPLIPKYHFELVSA